jgi:hypothetical protein
MGFRRRDIEKCDAAARDAAHRKHGIEHAGRMVVRGVFGSTRHLEHALAAGVRLANVRPLPNVRGRL